MEVPVIIHTTFLTYFEEDYYSNIHIMHIHYTIIFIILKNWLILQIKSFSPLIHYGMDLGYIPKIVLFYLYSNSNCSFQSSYQVLPPVRKDKKPLKKHYRTCDTLWNLPINIGTLAGPLRLDDGNESSIMAFIIFARSFWSRISISKSLMSLTVLDFIKWGGGGSQKLSALSTKRIMMPKRRNFFIPFRSTVRIG